MKTQVEFEIYGYGGELVIGSITKAQFDYWLPFIDKGETEGLDSHLFWDPYDEGEGNPITDEKDSCFLGYWHDMDNIAHSCGADLDSCTVVVTSLETGDEIFKTDEPNVSDTEHYEDTQLDPGYYFKGYAYEKGQFFLTELEIEGKFDPNKLTVRISNIDGNHIIDQVEYDGEYLENEGGGTNGKGNDYEFVEIP